MFNTNRTENEIHMMNPLIWAYIGDSVYDLYIRQGLIEETEYKPHKLHLLTSSEVNAKAQALTLDNLIEILTDEEKEIVRRGRNCKNYHVPKNTSVEEYAKATAFEGLIGYLYLTKKFKRLEEILIYTQRGINKEEK